MTTIPDWKEPPLHIALDELVLKHGLEAVLANLTDVCSFRADCAYNDGEDDTGRRWEQAAGHIMAAVDRVREGGPLQ